VQLLTSEELIAFTRMGVFSSAVPLELIEATVTAEPIPDAVDVLGRLVDLSLVRRISSADGIVRFGMLTLLRERAGELLDASDESETVRARHAEVVSAVLEELENRSWSDARPREQIAALMPEARRAFEFAAASGQWELAALITGALTLHRHRDGGHDEGRRWLDTVCPQLDSLTGGVRAGVLLALGFDAWHHDEQDRARPAWADAVRMFDDLGDDLWLAYTLAFLGLTDNDVTGGSTERGVGHVERGVALARSVGRPALLATVLAIAGEFFRTIGDYTRARPLYEEAASIARSIDDRAVLSVAVANLAYVACHDGDFAEGRRLGRTGLELSVAAGRRQFAAWSVSELAEPALGLGELELGAQLVGAAERALAAMGGRIYPGDLATHERVIAGLIDALGQDRYEQEYARGASVNLDEAIRIALGDQRSDPSSDPSTIG
jgi:tetratricopeptide (TPR) repeat protein